MAQIPPEDLHYGTVERIYQHYEDNQEDGLRPHLGASLIGKPCSREIWYKFRWAGKKPWKGRLLRLVETGKLAEERFVKNLRDIGVTVREFDENGKQLTISFFGGHFGGSLDGEAIGLPEAPKTWHVVEMKTHNEKSFEDLVKRSVKLSKPEHYAQMMMYMGGRGLSRALYFAVNKNTDELYVERIRFDRVFFDELVRKGGAIVFNDYAPSKLSNDPTSWNFSTKSGCKYCDFVDVCHFSAVPLVNCRTCLHAKVETNGTWSCNKFHITLDNDRQKIGCQNHLFLPTLIGEPVDAGETFVQYKDGRMNLEGGAIV